MPASGSGASSTPTHNHRLSWSDGMSASGASPCTSRGSRHHCSPYLGAAHSWRQRSSARLRMSHASPMSPLSRVSRASVRFRCGRAALRARCVTAQPAIGKSNRPISNRVDTDHDGRPGRRVLPQAHRRRRQTRNGSPVPQAPPSTCRLPADAQRQAHIYQWSDLMDRWQVGCF